MTNKPFVPPNGGGASAPLASPLAVWMDRMGWQMKVMYCRAMLSPSTVRACLTRGFMPTMSTAYRILDVVRDADPDGGWTLETLFPRGDA